MSAHEGLTARSRLTSLRRVYQASAFVAQGVRPAPAVRAVSPVCQFGTSNTDNNGGDMKGNPNFVFSPIVGGSTEYPYGQYELDQSGEIPAKLLALTTIVGLPVCFAVSIWTAAV